MKKKRNFDFSSNRLDLAFDISEERSDEIVDCLAESIGPERQLRKEAYAEILSDIKKELKSKPDLNTYIDKLNEMMRKKEENFKSPAESLIKVVEEKIPDTIESLYIGTVYGRQEARDRLSHEIFIALALTSMEDDIDAVTLLKLTRKLKMIIR